jgi:hypothetical protein
MYDSVRPGEIPADAEMVALYVDGKYAATAADWNRFTRAVKVRISAVGSNVNAHVFDVENGCIWPPAAVVPLVVAARKLGIDPTVYVNQNNDWEPTRRAFDAAGVAHPHWWVANYDNRKTVPAGAVAKQYADPGMPGVGGHYDLSVVADFWPGVDGSFDNPEKDEGDDVPNISQSDLDKLLAAADKITHEYKVSDGTPPRPFGTDVADDLPGQVMSIRARQEAHIALNRLMNTGIASIETVVNQILAGVLGADQVTLTDAQAQAGFESLGAQLAAQSGEAIEDLYRRLVDTNSVDAVRKVFAEYAGRATVALEFQRQDTNPPTGG